MVKNTTGGNKTKNKARKNIAQTRSINYSEISKTDDQDYAKILKVFGSGRYQVLCLSDKIERLGISRGKMNSRGKIVIDSLVLISKRDYQDSKCDILYLYDRDELKVLQHHGDIASDCFVAEDEEHDENADIHWDTL